MKKFEFISHTADFKIRVYGKNFIDLINNSLSALLKFLKPKLTKDRIEKKINEVKINKVEDLIDFLSDILSKIYINKVFFIKYKNGNIIGYKFLNLDKEIKAITYHQAKLIKKNNIYIFEFIIDI